jgi:DNA-binding MarR family transcriptional regulator
LDALEAAGFVVRAAHPKDRRAILVTLTNRGSSTMAQMEYEGRQIAAELVADLDADQQERLSQDLHGIVARLNLTWNVRLSGPQGDRIITASADEIP